jgi:hypothetical protein
MLLRGIKSFAWGTKEDIHLTLDVDIIMTDILLEPVNRCCNLGLKTKDGDKVLSLMVV